MLAAEHEIDLQRLIDEGRLADPGVELLLQPIEQARTEHAFERGMIGGIRCRQQPRVLAEPVALGQRHLRIASGVAGRRIAQPVQQRQNLIEIVVGDQRLLDQRRAGGCIFVVELHGLLDQIGILLVAGEPRNAQSDGAEADQR